MFRIDLVEQQLELGMLQCLKRLKMKRRLRLGVLKLPIRSVAIGVRSELYS